MAAGSLPTREFVAETARPAAESPHPPATGISEPAARPQGQFIARLRRKPLEVVLVIQRGDAVDMRPVRAKLVQLVDGIHRLVPNAKIGVIAYDQSEVSVLPLINSAGSPKRFLRGIETRQAFDDGSNTLSAIKIAVDGIRWQSGGTREIVWLTGSGPSADSFDELLALVDSFHAGHGVFNIVNISSPPPRLEPHTFMSVMEARQRRAMLERLAHAGGGELRELDRSGPHELKRRPLAGEQFAGQPASIRRAA